MFNRREDLGGKSCIQILFLEQVERRKEMFVKTASCLAKIPQDYIQT